MKAVTAIGDMGHSQIFTGWQQVLDSPGNQRAQGDLKWQRADVQVIVPGAGWMQVNAVTADADRVGEGGRADLVATGAGLLHPRLGPDMLLQHGELRANPPALADVRVLGQPV